MHPPLLSPRRVTAYLLCAFLCLQAALLARAQTVPQPLPEVRALLDRGQEATAQGKRDNAAALYEQALQLARERKDRPGEAESLWGLAVAIIYAKPRESIGYAEQALGIYRDLQDKPGQGKCFLVLGNACLFSSQPQKALEHYDAAAKLAQESGNKKGYAAALSNAGTVYIRTGQPYKALECLLPALAIYEELGNKDGVMTSLGNLGAAYRNARDLPRAVETLEKALVLARELGSRQDEGIILLNLGLAHTSVTGPRKALECFERARPLLEETGDKRTVAAVLTSMAQAHSLEGELFKALETSQRALEMHHEVGDKGGQARSLSNLGALYEEVGQPLVALEHYQKALELSREASDVLAQMGTLNNMGQLYGKLGRRAQEQDCYQQSLRLHEGSKNNYQDERAETLLRLTRALMDAGKHQEALAQAEEARDLLQQASDVPREARAELRIGDLLLRLGRIAEARTRYERALKLFQDTGSLAGEAEAAADLGAIDEAQGRTSQAEGHYTRALALLEESRAGLGRLTEAKSGYLEQQLPVYHRYIRFLLRSGQNARAFEWTQKAKARVLVDLMQSGKVDVSQGMTEADRTQEQDLQRREKLLSQKTLAAQAVLEDFQRQPQPDRSRQERAKAEAEALQKQQQQLEREWRVFRDQMFLRNPRLAQQRAARVATLPEAAAALPADTALLDYCYLQPDQGGGGQQEAALFVVTRQGSAPRLQVFRTPAAGGSLSRLANGLREACADRPGTSDARPYQPLARELYRLLIAPAQPALAGKQRLIICPDGPLWDIPFQALIAEGKGQRGAVNSQQSAISRKTRTAFPERRTASTRSAGTRAPDAERLPAPFLWERYSIAYGYSATGTKAALDARDRADRPRPQKSLLVIASPALGPETRPSVASTRSATGDPAPVGRGLYLRAGLSALPSTRLEARTIASSFPDATLKLGEEAQESVVKQTGASYRHLHFATHAVFNDASPLLSAVLLARPPKDSPEDGVLTARELFEMSLGANTVVLSACDTARGAQRRGEGVIGLTWALFVAGSPSQVVSQWSVDDAATAQLMSGFYRGLKGGKGKDAALRDAALALLRDGKHNHPFYWAPFILMGDWRPAAP